MTISIETTPVESSDRRIDKTTPIQEIANQHGQFVDVHARFLKGDTSWFTATIEPSLRGASEVRRAFLSYVMSSI